MAYSWLTLADAKKQLAARLADPGNVFWIDDELAHYIREGLRVWNALTFTWKTQFTFTIPAAAPTQWYSLGALTGSPRLRLTLDTNLYTYLQYHLLEPPTGGTWTGTSQFSIDDLAFALRRCLDEAIQAANCNQIQAPPVPSIPNQRSAVLDDTWLDVARALWIPVEGSVVALVRTDDTALNYYQSGYLQTPSGTPSQYNLASLPPLVLEVDVPPADPGSYDLLVLSSGGPLAPPTDTLLQVPNDNAWTLKWGVLADLLDRESEATDRLRAAYCRQRYTDGLKVLQNTPWVMQAEINGVAADLVSVIEMDRYRPDWDSQGPDFQTVVIAGTDTFTVVPDPGFPMSVSLTMLGNAPVPVADTDFIQCSRDVWDAILDYCQFLAAFKQGGAEFTAAQDLEKGFLATAVATNGRLMKLGLFADLFVQEGGRQGRAQERFRGE
jgi:hypothetical protein